MTRTLLLGCILVAPLLSLALIGTNIYLALAPMFVSHMLLLYATLVPNCQWWGPVMTKFDTAEREVWLTIDDGPSARAYEKDSRPPRQFDARATFFVVGAKAEEHPHLITEILARGHALANHTQTHPRGSFWCAETQVNYKVKSTLCGNLRTTPERPALFFRAPAGMKNPFVHPALVPRGP